MGKLFYKKIEFFKIETGGGALCINYLRKNGHLYAREGHLL